MNLRELVDKLRAGLEKKREEILPKFEPARITTAVKAAVPQVAKTALRATFPPLGAYQAVKDIKSGPLGNIPIATERGFFDPQKPPPRTSPEWIRLREYFEPKQYLGGRVGKQIATDIETALMAMYPTVRFPDPQTLALRTIYPEAFKTLTKPGFAPSAMLKTGAKIAAIPTALSLLRGEKPEPKQVATSFVMGMLYGGLQPKPLLTASETEIGQARIRLRKYGFTPKDSTATLKSRAAKTVFEIHPDKFIGKGASKKVVAAQAKEFAQFWKDYQTITSAGNPPSFKLPDITSWIKGLWTKKPTTGKELALAGKAPVVRIRPTPPADLFRATGVKPGVISEAETRRIAQQKLAGAEGAVKEKFVAKPTDMGPLAGAPSRSLLGGQATQISLGAKMPTPLEEAIKVAGPKVSVTQKEITTAYKDAGLKIDKIQKSRLGDGYFVYHKHAAPSFEKGRLAEELRKDFIDSPTSLKIHVAEALNRAKVETPRVVAKIKPDMPRGLEENVRVLVEQSIPRERYLRMIEEDIRYGTPQQRRDAQFTVKQLKDAGYTPETFYDTFVKPVTQPPISEPKIIAKIKPEEKPKVIIKPELPKPAEEEVPPEVAEAWAKELEEARKAVKKEKVAIAKKKTGRDFTKILSRMHPTKEGKWALPTVLDGKKVRWDEVADELGFTGVETVEPKPGQIVNKELYDLLVSMKGGQPGEAPRKMRGPRKLKKKAKPMVKIVKEAPRPKTEAELRELLTRVPIPEWVDEELARIAIAAGMGIEKYKALSDNDKWQVLRNIIKGEDPMVGVTGVPAAVAPPPAPPVPPMPPVVPPIPEFPEGADPDAIISEYEGQISKEPGKKKRDLSFDKFYTDVVNRLYPIEKIAKRAGEIPPGSDPLYLTRRYYGIAGVVEAKLFYRTSRLDPETGEIIKTGKSLAAILRPVEEAGMLRDFRALLLAERDIELASRDIHGMDPEKAPMTISALKKKHGDNFQVLQNAVSEKRDWDRKAILDPLREVGMLSDEQYKRILASNQFYTPMNRVMEEIENEGYVPKNSDLFTPRGLPIKRIKGSERPVIDPLESSITNVYRVTDVAERARVSRAIANLPAIKEELGEEIYEVKPRMVPVARQELRAEVDKKFLNDLIKFAKGLGLKEFETKGRAGRTLGYYSKVAKKAVRKFATSRETAAHEVGHFFDDKYGLKKKFYLSRKDTKEVGQEIMAFSEAKGEPPARLKKPAERFASAFSWWLTHRYAAERRMPLFSEAMVDILTDIPELRGLLNIRPSPKQEIETMPQLIFGKSPFAPERDTIPVFVDGVRKWYKVPHDVYLATTNLHESDVGSVIRALGTPARWLRAGAVLAPEFIVRNPLRDPVSAMVYTKYGFIPGIDTAKGFFNMVNRGEMYQQWLEAGGAHSMITSLDRLVSRTTLNEVLGKGGKIKDLKGVVRDPLEALRILSEASEKMTRVPVFERAMEAGASPLEAMYESREATLDFAVHGAKMKAANTLKAFLGARILGIDKMVRSFKERPGSTLLRSLFGITLVSLLLYAANKDDERYRQLPQWQKDNFWIFPIGKTGPILRYPKPFELGMIFGTFAEYIWDYINGKDPEAITGNVLSFLKETALEFLPLPTAFQPIVENIADYDFFRGRPVVGESLKRLMPEQQYQWYTSEVAKKFGEMFKVSPIKAEHLWHGYTASLGKYGLAITDAILDRLGVVEVPERPTKTLADMPGIRALIAREPIGSQSESVNRFYNELERVNAMMNTYKDFSKRGQEEKAISYLRDHPEVFFATGLNSASRTLSAYRQQKNSIFYSDLSAEEKRKAIDYIDRMMTNFAEVVLQSMNKGVLEARVSAEPVPTPAPIPLYRVTPTPAPESEPRYRVMPTPVPGAVPGTEDEELDGILEKLQGRPR